MLLTRTTSVGETRALAAEVAAVAVAGDVILLSGDLGSGKTAFVQGFAAALGVKEHVTSPTFTLVHSYAGRIPIVHCDVYRLEHLQDVIDLALPEMLDDGAVALVEWGDAVASTFPPDFLAVSISFGEEAAEGAGAGDTVAPGAGDTVASGAGDTVASGDADAERIFRLRPVGPSWSARFPELRKRLARWEWA